MKKDDTRREWLMVWGPSLLAIVLGFAFAWRFVGPPPPKKITIATGETEGAYYAFAGRYQQLLKPHGLELEIVSTAGSVENLSLLRSGGADVAFIQGGTAEGRGAGLQSLASIYLEPLWVFYREGEPLTRISGLAGKRVAAGDPGSGTLAVGLKLLEANGLSGSNTSIIERGGRAAADELKAGETDAALFISAPNSPLIQELLLHPGLRLLNVRRHLGYRSRFPFLSSVALGEGMIDLGRNIPAEETQLLAPVATLVSRDDLHPDLVPLVLEIATEVHGEGGFFEEPGQFPSSRFVEIPLADEARRYLKTGPTFLQRYLPFWAANLADRLMIMILPLLTLLIPIFKMAPPLYRWRVRAKIYRWYRILREVDRRLGTGPTPEELAHDRGRLADLESELNEINVPLSYMNEFYNLHLHIGHIHCKLEKVGGSPAPPGQDSTAGPGPSKL